MNKKIKTQTRSAFKSDYLFGVYLRIRDAADKENSGMPFRVVPPKNTPFRKSYKWKVHDES